MTDAPDLEPTALKAARDAIRNKCLEYFEKTWDFQVSEMFASTAIRAYLAARSAPEAGKAVDAPQFILRQVGEISFDDPEDEGPITGLVLEGSVDAVRAAAKFFGEKVCVIPTAALASSPAPTGADVRQIIFDALDLSEELRVECTADVVNALESAGISLASPQPAPTGEIAGLRRMSDAHREHAQSAVEHNATLNRLLSIAEARADRLEAEAADLRRKLEEARKALEVIASSDDIENALDPARNKRVARQALESDNG